VTGPAAHWIGALVFDLDVADPESALADAALLAQQVRAHLLDAVEEACEAVLAEAGTCRAEMLEIDLGTIGEPVDWPALRAEFTRRLRATMLQHVPGEARPPYGPAPDGRGQTDGLPLEAQSDGSVAGEHHAKPGAAATASGRSQPVTGGPPRSHGRRAHPLAAATRAGASASPPAAGAGRSASECPAAGFREEAAPWPGSPQLVAAGRDAPAWPGLAEALVRLLCRHAPEAAVEPVVRAVERAVAPLAAGVADLRVDAAPAAERQAPAQGDYAPCPAGADMRDGPSSDAPGTGTGGGRRRRRGRRGGTDRPAAARGETGPEGGASGRAGRTGHGSASPAPVVPSERHGAGRHGTGSPAARRHRAREAPQASDPEHSGVGGAGGGTTAAGAASRLAAQGLNGGSDQGQGALRAKRHDAPGESRAASALKGLWARDPDAVRAALAGRSAEELGALAEILIGRSGGAGVPLRAACAELAARPGGSRPLAAVLAGVLAGSQVDIAALLAREAEREAADRGPAAARHPQSGPGSDSGTPPQSGPVPSAPASSGVGAEAEASAGPLGPMGADAEGHDGPRSGHRGGPAETGGDGYPERISAYGDRQPDTRGGGASGRGGRDASPEDGLAGGAVAAMEAGALRRGWREDRGAVAAALDVAAPDALLSLLERVLATGVGAPPPPLLAASEAAARRARRPAALLRAVLAQVLDDEPVDLEAVAAALDAAEGYPAGLIGEVSPPGGAAGNRKGAPDAEGGTRSGSVRPDELGARNAEAAAPAHAGTSDATATAAGDVLDAVRRVLAGDAAGRGALPSEALTRPRAVGALLAAAGAAGAGRFAAWAGFEISRRLALLLRPDLAAREGVLADLLLDAAGGELRERLDRALAEALLEASLAPLPPWPSGAAAFIRAALTRAAGTQEVPSVASGLLAVLRSWPAQGVAPAAGEGAWRTNIGSMPGRGGQPSGAPARGTAGLSREQHAQPVRTGDAADEAAERSLCAALSPAGPARATGASAPHGSRDAAQAERAADIVSNVRGRAGGASDENPEPDAPAAAPPAEAQADARRGAGDRAQDGAALGGDRPGPPGGAPDASGPTRDTATPPHPAGEAAAPAGRLPRRADPGARTASPEGPRARGGAAAPWARCDFGDPEQAEAVGAQPQTAWKAAGPAIDAAMPARAASGDGELNGPEANEGVSMQESRGMAGKFGQEVASTARTRSVRDLKQGPADEARGGGPRPEGGQPDEPEPGHALPKGSAGGASANLERAQDEVEPAASGDVRAGRGAADDAPGGDRDGEGDGRPDVPARRRAALARAVDGSTSAGDAPTDGGDRRAEGGRNDAAPVRARAGAQRREAAGAAAENGGGDAAADGAPGGDLDAEGGGGPDDPARRRAAIARAVDGSTSAGDAPTDGGDRRSAGGPADAAPVRARAGAQQREAAEAAARVGGGDAAAEEGEAEPTMSSGPVPGGAVVLLMDSLRALARPARGAPADAGAEAVLLSRAAGLVLLGPYLPVLFERLGLVRAGQAPGLEAARAMDVLQALPSRDLPERPDARPLERIVCGLPLGGPLAPPRRLEPEAEGVVEDLLAAVIARWSAIGNTSVDGLREAFLQREGILRRTESGWKLEVAPRAYDMLLDRLPWGVSVLKTSWMPEAVLVSWRT
jgi:hypothetical protein